MIQTYLVLFVLFACTPLLVHAGQEDEFSGWAWSENIGWISMNCTNTNYCDTVDYGVALSGSGPLYPLTGWAWSENMGWIDFSGAFYDSSDGSLSGTAVVYNTTISPYRSGDAQDDGWDGVIDLSGSGTVNWGPIADNTDNTADGWDWDDSQYYLFDDYAWGDDIVGWISFSCQNESSCGSVGYGVFLEPFSFEFTANKGLTPGDEVIWDGTYTHSWTLDPDTAITSCTASGGPGTWSDAPNKSTSPSPLSELVSGAQSSATSTLACTHSSGKTITRSLYIYVGGPAPQLTFTADDQNVAYADSTTLRWDTQYVSDCTASAGDASWSGSVATGTGQTYATDGLTGQTTYNLTCNGVYGGQAFGSVTVDVQGLSMDFRAENSAGVRITNNQLVPFSDKEDIDLVWDTEFATGGCSASGDWNGTKVTPSASNDSESGSQPAPISNKGTFTYTLTCTGELGQEISQTVDLKVSGNPGFSEEIQNSFDQ